MSNKLPIFFDHRAHKLDVPILDTVLDAFPLPELPGSVSKDCLKKAKSAVQGFMRREAQA